MRSLKVGEGDSQQTYICVHWRTFPPAGAGEDAESLRANATLDTAQYERLRLWQRVCGLFHMEKGKCLACPHRRKVVWKTRGPYLVSPDGVETPVVDSAQGEASPRNRHMINIFRRPGTSGSHEPAAWTERSEDE
jgi:hypothetical protein